jgi:hypothetical protein
MEGLDIFLFEWKWDNFFYCGWRWGDRMNGNGMEAAIFFGGRGSHDFF